MVHRRVFDYVSFLFFIFSSYIYRYNAFFEISGLVFLNLITIIVYPLGIMWLYFERYLRNTEPHAPIDMNSLSG